MTDRPEGTLFRHTKETYEGSFDQAVLEQYKLYVQSTENVSARRVASSRYLLTLNVALVALYGYQASNPDPGWWAILVPILGALVSVLWHRIIKSHKDLNAVKFEIVQELEQHLPASLYTHEWRLAEEGRGRSYRSVTDIEQWIPLVFLALHFVLLAVLAAHRLPDCAA